MNFGEKRAKTRRLCAALLAVFFLAFAVCVASLPPDKFFAGLSPQNKVDSLLRALKIIEGTGRVEDAGVSVPRSLVACAWPGSGHRMDISLLPPAGEREPAYDFTAAQPSRAGGVDTVARE